MPFADLREFLTALETQGLIHWVPNPVDKEGEISAITHLLFSRVSEDQRFALGFRNVRTGGKLVVGTIGASRRIYGLALGCDTKPQEIVGRWNQALDTPIEPEMTNRAPCQEIVLNGNQVDLRQFPIPTWIPDKDAAPFINLGCMVTKDPETGVRNVGIYRLQYKSPNATAVLWDTATQHAAMHYASYQALGKAMPVAVAIGLAPDIIISAASKIPYGRDELGVAGGLRGKAIPLTRCRTVDLEVPAHAEIVLEGEIGSSAREPEGPGGEYTGYMGNVTTAPLFHVNCITHRRDPIYQAVHSGMPPNENSLFRQITEEARVYQHLVHQMKLPGILDCHLPESGSSYAILWIRMKPAYAGHVQQVLCASWAYRSALAKWVVATDEDVDIRDAFAREWTLSWRVEPARDTFIIPNTAPLLLDPSLTVKQSTPSETHSSKICIDATRKSTFPSIALPPQTLLDDVSMRWGEYGLPEIKS